MPRDQIVPIAPKKWVEITDANVSEITFQIQKGPLKLRVTSGAAPSNTSSDGLIYSPTVGEVRVSLASLAPGVVGATRVFVWSDLSNTVWVSHA